MHFEKHLKEWKTFYDSTEPHVETFPDPWDDQLKHFQKIIILRCLRPDKVRLGVGQLWISRSKEAICHESKFESVVC